MQHAPHRQLIGILGGMGPAATIDFMTKLRISTPAERDQDHVPLMVHDVPQIPDRVSAVASGGDAPLLPMLAGIAQLERAGAQYIAIPCNTAHRWYDELSKACRVPILHIADAVTAMMAETPASAQPIGLMATRGTIQAGIYQPRFGGAGQSLLIPDEAVQATIDRAIAATKAGQFGFARRHAELAAQSLLDAGARRLLLACTELPLALAGSKLLNSSIDATEALARLCVKVSVSETC
jgi:aspartate racemase